MTGGLSDLDREQLSKTAARTSVLLKTPERVERICADIAKHFQDKVEPNGFGAQVVTCDRERGVLYKQELDRVLPPETSDVVTTVHGGEDEYATYRRNREAEERLLDSYLARLWEALSPDPSVESYEEDYRWLSQVCESVKPCRWPASTRLFPSPGSRTCPRAPRRR